MDIMIYSLYHSLKNTEIIYHHHHHYHQDQVYASAMPAITYLNSFPETLFPLCS